MDRNLLKKVFEYQLFVEIPGYFVFKDGELLDSVTDESMKFESVEDLLAYDLGGRTVEDELDKIDFQFYYHGGNGAASGKMGGGFTNADNKGGRKGKDYGKVLYPATFNRQGRFATQDGAVKAFADKYKNADREYGISVDKDGFVHRHVQGGKSSVAISAAGKGHMIVHNHPSGGNFSKADLLNTARNVNDGGVVAVGNKYTYTLKKGAHFDGKKFAKAVNKAKWPEKYDYNKGAHWWLKKHAGEFGYTYTRTKS